jgi:hypothetical protein
LVVAVVAAVAPSALAAERVTAALEQVRLGLARLDRAVMAAPHMILVLLTVAAVAAVH